MNEWVGLAVGVTAVLAGVAALMRWTVSQLDARIDTRLTAGLVPLQRRFAGLDAKFDGLSTEFAGLSTQFAGLDAKFDRLDARVDDLDTKVDRLDARVDRLDARVERLDTKLDHLAEVVDLRLRPLEADMALIKQHLLGTPAA